MKLARLFSFLGLALLLVFSSCTMEKRVYMSGYHIEWNKSKHAAEKQEFANKKEIKSSQQNKISTVQTSENKNSAIKIIQKNEITKLLNQKNIFLKNPLQTLINTSKIDTTHAKNNTQKVYYYTNEQHGFNHFAVGGFVCSTVGVLFLILELTLSLFSIPAAFFFLSILLLVLGIIFSAIGINGTKIDGLNGKTLSIFGLALGIAALAILILYVVLIIVILSII